MKPHLLFPILLASPASAQSGITIYNQGVAVVRESLPLKLDAGVNKLTFDRATALVRPDSVVLRDPAGKVAFSLLEQGYRNDPVSQSLLLQHFEGQTISFQKTDQDGKISDVRGKIVRSGYVPGGRAQSPIIEIEGNLQFSLPGLPVFPALGDDSILRPTLNWQIDTEEASEFEAQLSYLSSGFDWHASYNVVAPEKGEVVTINGWVTLKNHSGTAFTDAKVKLVAGEVNVQRPQVLSAPQSSMRFSKVESKKKQVTQKALDDFHLYTLPRPLTLRDRESKQVEFLGSASVRAEKKYVYAPSNQRFYGGWSRSATNSQASRDILTFWEFKNSKENGLGVPFPAGDMRFYRSDDADGNLEFVGENQIKHTPKNEMISVQTGTAFDLLGERKITSFGAKTLGPNRIRESFEITLTNRSESEKSIIVREPLWRWSNWKIEKNSQDFKKINAHTIEFEVLVPADAEKTVSYTAYYFEK